MPETKPCEHCGKPINVRVAVCPFCGEKNQGELLSGPPLCPRCKTTFETLMEEGEEYDLCSGCGGLWMDRGEFHRATREAAVYRRENAQEKPLKRTGPGPAGYIPCVRCGKLMNRRNFGRISGVIVDECGAHGVWLDAGEMERIRKFIVDGGLERSQDREIEKNREEIRQVASQLRHVAFTQRLIHFWNPKRWFFGP